MSEHRTTRRDQGFTLPEVLIVIVIMGLVATAIAAAFTVIVRTAPSTEARADDAHSLLGLTKWLPADVASASPTSFTTGNNPSGCSGITNPGTGLLEMSWTESTQTYRVNYRYVPDGGGYKVMRFACLNGAQTTSLSLSAELQNIAGNPPIRVNLIGSGPYDGITFEVDVVDPLTGSIREILSLEARTRNVPTTLPAVVPPAAEAPPDTDPTTTTLVPPDPTDPTTTAAPTTAAPVPCIVGVSTPSPSTIANRTNGNAPTDVGELADNVVVTITRSGDCGALVLAFRPDHQTDPSTVPQNVIEFRNALSVTIPKNAFAWRDNSAHPLEVREGSNGPIKATTSLAVT